MEVQYDPKLVRKYQFARADFDIQIASIVILYYDYLLTLPSEIKFIWTQPKKPTTYFYFFCRYALIANLLWTLEKAGRPEVGAALHDLQNEGLTCNTVAKTAGAFALFGHIGVLAVWGLRTHALATDKQRKVVSWVLGFIAFAIVVSLIAKEVVQSCSDPAWLTNVGITIAVLVLLFEILAFGIAAIRAWSSVREDVKFWENPRKSLNYVVFSQGLLYLSAVLFSSIITAVCNLQIWGGFARPLNSLKLPLSCLLTARFILKLRKWEHVSSASTMHRTTGWQADGRMSFSRGAFAGGGGGGIGGSDDVQYVDDVNGRRGRMNEKRTQSSEGETSTTMSFGVFGAGDTTIGTVAEDEPVQESRPAGNGSKLRRLLGTNVAGELGGNVGPSKSDEDVVLQPGLSEHAEHRDERETVEVVEMQARQQGTIHAAGISIVVEGEKGSERV